MPLLTDACVTAMSLADRSQSGATAGNPGHLPRRMVAIFDYDPRESSPNADIEVRPPLWVSPPSYQHYYLPQTWRECCVCCSLCVLRFTMALWITHLTFKKQRVAFNSSLLHCLFSPLLRRSWPSVPGTSSMCLVTWMLMASSMWVGVEENSSEFFSHFFTVSETHTSDSVFLFFFFFRWGNVKSFSRHDWNKHTHTLEKKRFLFRLACC